VQQNNTLDLSAIGAASLGAFTPTARKPQTDFGQFINRAESQTRDAVRAPENGKRPEELQAGNEQRFNDQRLNDQKLNDQRASERDASKTARSDEQANQQSVERADTRRSEDRASEDKFTANRDAQKRDDVAKPTATADKPKAETPAAKPAADSNKAGETKDPGKALVKDAKQPDAPTGIAALAIQVVQNVVMAAVAVVTPTNASAAVKADGATSIAGAGKGANAAADALVKAGTAGANSAATQIDPALLAKAAVATQGQATQGQVTQGQATQAQAATAQVAAQAQATGQPVVPDMLLQAATALGPIKVQVEGTQKPANLAIQLLQDHAQVTPDGPIAPVTMLDGAASTGISSQLLELSHTLAKDTLVPLPDEALPDANLIAAGTIPVAEHKPVTDAAPPPKDAQESTQAQDVARQVLDQVDRIKVGHQNSVKLQLMPEHLGKMEIRVVSHNGVISAQLSADSQSSKAMLESQVANLQASFAEMGLKVDKVEVTLSSANLNFAGGGNNAFAGFNDGQQGQQGQAAFAQAPRMSNGLGYEQWMGDDAGEEHQAIAERDTAINYVA
jgi:flagellar hook-length control protein FliK